MPDDDQLTFRGGIWGCATKAIPPSPKSARQTAFQVPTLSGSLPRTMLPMLWAVAVTIDSIMNPVFGTPQGTGVGPIGGIATQTPTAKMLRYFGFCWCLSTMVNPRGLLKPSIPDTGLIPRNAGSIIEKAKGRSFSGFATPSSPTSSTTMWPASTRFTRVLVIHLMCFSRIWLSRSPLVSPTPSRPRCPM